MHALPYLLPNLTRIYFYYITLYFFPILLLADVLDISRSVVSHSVALVLVSQSLVVQLLVVQLLVIQLLVVQLFDVRS